MQSWFARWQVLSISSRFYFSQEMFLSWQPEEIWSYSNPKCFVFVYFTTSEIWESNHFVKLNFPIIGRMDGVKKQQAHLFSHFNILTSPVKIIKAAAAWSFIFLFKTFFPLLFLQSLKKEGLQINNMSIFAQ